MGPFVNAEGRVDCVSSYMYEVMQDGNKKVMLSRLLARVEVSTLIDLDKLSLPSNR